jgi:hypothetical protein
MINEVATLPPDMDKEAEILAGFIASFFIRYFQTRISHAKTKSDQNIVKYNEYYKLAKQYREVGKQHFKVEPTNTLVNWGKANYRIHSLNEILPDVILKIGGGYSMSHDAYVDEEKKYAEVVLYVDTYHFVKSFKKSTADMMATLKHEILHCVQMTEPDSGVIGKMRGMPKDKVMSKTHDVYGRKSPGAIQTKSHPVRDIEFKPNLITYTHYIKNYLNRNFSITEWKDAFRKIIMGYEVNTANEVINNYSFGLGYMRKADNERWKQFVKELYIMVFKNEPELEENMINLRDTLMENRTNQTAKKGCLMAMIPQDKTNAIVNFGKRLIKDSDLYLEGNEYGRETEGHVTIRYGFLKDLNELEIRQLITGQKPFIVELYGLDKFDSDPKYDVAMFKASSPVLKQLNEMSGIYLTESEYNEYNPHLTLAYVQKGKFPYIKEGLRIQVPIKTICYSPIQGGKSYFEL